MMYTVLFLGLPVVGVLFYLKLLQAMSAAGVASPPRVPLFFVFAAYGAVLLFVVSEYFRAWSGMHSLAALGLIVVGVPWLLVEGFFWRRFWAVSAYHRAAILLSFAFPVVFALLIAFTFAVRR